MYGNILTRNVDNWSLMFSFIKEMTGLNTVALEFPAWLIDDALVDSNEKLLYDCKIDDNQDNQTTNLMRNVWQKLENNRLDFDRKSLTCNMHTSKFVKIGKVRFNSNDEGCGKITVLIKPIKYLEN